MSLDVEDLENFSACQCTTASRTVKLEHLTSVPVTTCCAPVWPRAGFANWETGQLIRDETQTHRDAALLEGHAAGPARELLVGPVDLAAHLREHGHNRYHTVVKNTAKQMPSAQPAVRCS